MDNEKIIYTCSACNKETKIKKGEKIPICCEKEMVVEPLPHCTSVPHSEMSRNNSSDEPCDDGRSNK
jgi:hypothetical protein